MFLPVELLEASCAFLNSPRSVSLRTVPYQVVMSPNLEAKQISGTLYNEVGLNGWSR